MELSFWFKGENGKLESRRIYFFEEEGLTKLKEDFHKYSQGPKVSSIKGGWYKCKYNDKEMIVFLKFDEILYIG
jgi:hypothetical protein